jgi:hypothetical protein
MLFKRRQHLKTFREYLQQVVFMPDVSLSWFADGLLVGMLWFQSSPKPTILSLFNHDHKSNF